MTKAHGDEGTGRESLACCKEAQIESTAAAQQSGAVVLCLLLGECLLARSWAIVYNVDRRGGTRISSIWRSLIVGWERALRVSIGLPLWRVALGLLRVALPLRWVGLALLLRVALPLLGRVALRGSWVSRHLLLLALLRVVLRVVLASLLLRVVLHWRGTHRRNEVA
jgi:hypothetical protein